jgi:ATP-dependent Clp protease ATP-binding subunit ClpA
MFDRFTNSARSVVLRARDIAQSKGRRFVEPDHFLSATIELYPELFEKISDHSIDLQSVQRELAQLTTASHTLEEPIKLRFSEQSKRVMQAAMREARSCWEQRDAPRRSHDQMLPEDQSYWEGRFGQRPIRIAELPKWFVRWRLRRRWEVDERYLLIGLLGEAEYPGVAVLAKRGVTLETARQRLCPPGGA